MKRIVGCAVVVALAVSAPQNGAIAQVAVSCESLASLTLPATTVTSAARVRAGAVTGPGAPPADPAGAPLIMPDGSNFSVTLPAFCRVTATLRPSSDPDIKMEVWLPQSGWNGKFMGISNGGWGGTISYLGLVTAFYGNAARLSYWSGCSTGGRQGLKAAQKYPADFDAILAGAPANDLTHQAAHALWVPQAVAKDPSSFPGEKLAALNRSVIDACDAIDGVSDGVLEDPTVCRFDPKTIQCSGVIVGFFGPPRESKSTTAPCPSSQRQRFGAAAPRDTPW
jgi:feruloyl esterase